MDPGLLARALRRARAIPWTHVAVAALVIAYTVFLSYLSIQSHRGLKTVMNDLGNADQALWGASRGDWRMTESNDVDQVLRSRFGIHANFIFFPLSLLYRISPDPEILLVVTSASCALAGLGVYLFACARLRRSGWAAVAAAAYLASPIVHDANLLDFHVVTMISALLAWALWAFETRRRRLAFALLLLAMSCKEDVALIVVMIGVYLALSRQRRLGLAVGAFGVAYFVLVTRVVIPLMNKGEGLDTIVGAGSRYMWLGATLKEMLINAVTDPVRWIGRINRPDHLRIPVYLLLCGGIVSLREYRMLLVLSPQVLMGLLANAWMNRITGTYYWIISETIVVLAVVLASERRARARRTPWPLVYLAAATGTFFLLLSPLPLSLYGTWANFAVPPERPTLEEVRALIPANGSISAQNNLGPQLSQRGDIASYPRRLKTARYVLFHLRYPGGPDAGLAFRTAPSILFQMGPDELIETTRSYINSREWGLRAQGDGFYLFERNTRHVIVPYVAHRRLDEDAAILRAQTAEAVKHRRSWSLYLVNHYSWWDVFKWLHLVRPDAPDPWVRPGPKVEPWKPAPEAR